MMRVARVVSFVLIGIVAFAVRSQAQMAAPVGADSSKFFAAFDVAATFGHQSSGAFGGEVGMGFARTFAVSIEVGQMKNVGTQELDNKAQNIATSVGATASSRYRVNFFDVAARYMPEMGWKAKTYVMAGFGVAKVFAETDLAVNGTTVPPESLGVQFGNDLNGSLNKPMFVLGGGAMYPINNMIFVDGSYRYGRIFPDTAEIENDHGINTNRLQIGIGVKF